MGSKRAQKRAKREARRRTRRAQREAVAPSETTQRRTGTPARHRTSDGQEWPSYGPVISTRPPEAAPAAQEKPSPTRAADPLIGYLARHDLHVLCDGDGCIIAGSREKLQDIIRRSGPAAARMDTIQSATFSEILAGMQLGGAYCLDEEAYGRFLEPGRRMGMPLADEDFSDPGPLGMHFVRVQWLVGRLSPG